jgi:exoribonuclease II
MENQTSKVILLAIAIGIWAIVLQNAGLIPTSQNVKVVNSVDVNGSVRVSGEVDANVGNTVDINISEVNGKSNAFYGRPGQSFDAIHVYTGN